ncbi:CDP-alcohol phosphatidyltransferase family protein [Arthrobacter zhaoxinii]|uniref:CDP-alcohol phosphatidyltransferase family protein n=1 Tax=Arthrobacter zhaoxinii TaxID=2964616 RepID=UPI002103C814|nr:CDP-alcohol phosphatidyltransferase family protein [Arthrobacter zhaoxinii]MCQ2001740.1 CDP-alcohol phosphatidyltransferase family protein [Arthrobacter zhaoxinii]
MSQTLPQTRATFRESFNQLKQAQKTRKGAPLYLLYVNRPAGRAVAAALRHTRLTPNHVTLAGAVCTYGSLVWLAFGAAADLSSALVGALLVVGYILDSADGQLARLQGTSSAFGEWLDHALDNGRITVMHVAAFCFLARTTDYDHIQLAAVCGLFLLSSSCIFFGGALLDQLRKNPRAPRGANARPSGNAAAPSMPAAAFAAAAGGDANRDSGRAENRRANRADNRRMLMRSAVTLPVDYGMTCLAFLLLPWPRVFLAAYLVLAAAHVLMAAAFLPKWRSELLALG